MKGSVEGRRPSGKPKNRWEDEARKYAVKLLNTKKIWLAASRLVEESEGDHGPEMGRRLVGRIIWQEEFFVV